MKNLSIRFKITLWFAAALTLVIALTYFIILSVSGRVIQKTIKDNLIETVTHNIDEVEYYSDISTTDLNNDVDHFIHYGNGFLEIDDDFLDEVNEVYTALYQADGTLLYGENPIARHTSGLTFTGGGLRTISVAKTDYYILDRELTGNGLDGLWLRGIVSEEQGAVQMSSISKMSLILLPMLALLAIFGGYLIARRMLQPIHDISLAASGIGKGGDLKKRINIGSGNDELHQLADTFNEMFARLDDAFEAERRFTSDASHELRTPMSVIMAQCEYSLEESGNTEDCRQALEVIQRQGRKMSKLINDMLNFTRLEIRAESYLLETLDMTELVSSLCTDMALMKENGITLTCHTDAHVLVHGNRELLTRLIANLISNAYRYGKANGHIHVTLQSGTDNVTLSVADDGIGIAKEEQDKIFHRFYQSDTSRSGTGFGLGLSMVYEIAQFHGGSVTVESEPGVGSTFTLFLPKI